MVAKNCTLAPTCLNGSSSFGWTFCEVVMRPPLPSIAAFTISESSALARLGAVLRRKKRRPLRSRTASSALASSGACAATRL